MRRRFLPFVSYMKKLYITGYPQIISASSSTRIIPAIPMGTLAKVKEDSPPEVSSPKSMNIMKFIAKWYDIAMA